MFDGIEHTGIAAADPERLAQWYVDTLGFTLIYRSETSRTCFVKAPNGSMIEFILAASAGGPYELKDPGLRHLAITVRDFDAALAALQQKGVPLLTEPSASKGNRVVFFADPEGNILHLIHRAAPL